MRHGDLQAAVGQRRRQQGRAVRLADRAGRRRRRVGAGQRHVRLTPSGKAAKRPSVQVGDPFLEKLLVECCLELYAGGLIEGIQDLGAAGIACATTELAAGGDGGMRVDMDAIPLRDPSLTPAEILMSESQERMMAVVRPDLIDAFLQVCAKWDVQATVIGEVTEDGLLTMTWRGTTVVRIPPKTAADGPVYERPMTRPAALDALTERRPRGAGPPGGRRWRSARPWWRCSARLTWPTSAGSPSSTTRIVRGNTVLAMPEDGGLVRIDEETGLGITLATDGNGRYCLLDPYQGTQLALAEAYRNVAMTGARPIAVTNCLNFGSPEDPEVMWQLAEAVRGLADGCKTLGIPVTGGNVSLYNQTGSNAIRPTPVIGVLGVHDDVRKRLGVGFPAEEARVVLLGTTSEEFGGSAWADVVHQHLGGRPPAVDLDAERNLAALIAAAAAEGVLASAHDLSDGGLGGGPGGVLPARRRRLLDKPGGFDNRAGVSAERPRTRSRRCSASPRAARWSRSRRAARTSSPTLCDEHGVPATVLGRTGGETLTVVDAFEIALTDLERVWSATLPALFG